MCLYGLQEKFCRIYTRDSSRAAVVATQNAFRAWHKARFGERAALRTPIRIRRGEAAAAADGGSSAVGGPGGFLLPGPAKGLLPEAAAATAPITIGAGIVTTTDTGTKNPRKRNLDGQFKAAAAAGPSDRGLQLRQPL